MTREERDAITHLEELFGEEMYNFAICIFTGGSTFYHEQEKNKEQNKTVLEFEDEIYKDEFSGNEGALGPLARRCKGGMVLFDNIEKDPLQRKAMVEKLIKKVDELRVVNRGKFYDNYIFRLVREERQKVAKQLQIDLPAAEREEKEAALRKQRSTVGMYSGKNAAAQKNYESSHNEKQMRDVEDAAQKTIMQKIKIKFTGCTIL